MSDSRTIVEQVKAVPKSMNTEVAANASTEADRASTDEFHQAVALLAYQRAESRNFESGHEMEDWLSAEAEFMAERKGLKGFPA
ncbi:MAG: DUF2934 domain-containing protein [Betaproteobacteria bacterium]